VAARVATPREDERGTACFFALLTRALLGQGGGKKRPGVTRSPKERLTF
jgi:hypothetical protein